MSIKAPQLYYGNYFGKDKWARRRFLLSYSLLEPFIKKNVDILDIGCYQADFLKLIKIPVNYYGVDFDRKALGIAQKRGAKTTIVDLEKDKIPFRKKFDIIVLTELLEHLKDPQWILAQAAQLLKSSGVVLISLPNECTIYHRLKVLLGKGIDSSGFEPFYHLHFPTLSQNEEFIGKYFKIIKKKYNAHLGLGGFLGKLSFVLPLSFWEILAGALPTLFARGGIYLCQKTERLNKEDEIKE